MMEKFAIIHGVSIAIISAAIIGYWATRLRQPVILGYIAAGIIIGPQLGLRWVTNPDAINFTSDLGLVALMFLVGLELDIRKIRKSGKDLLIIAIVQFALCLGLGLAFFNFSIFNDAGGPYATLYLAVVFSLSSTMIAVKILYDKFELDTLPGRTTLGVLFLQNIWIIVFLAIQPNLDNPTIGVLGLQLFKGLGLIAGCLLVSRFILPGVFKNIAKNPELVLVAALGWCFLMAWLSGEVVGLSRAMGALIAGVSLSGFPYIKYQTLYFKRARKSPRFVRQHVFV